MIKSRDRWTDGVILMALLIGLSSLRLAAQQEPADLQTNLGDLEVGSNWIYDDLDEGIQLAKASGKPLFVLFR